LYIWSLPESFYFFSPFLLWLSHASGYCCHILSMHPYEVKSILFFHHIMWTFKIKSSKHERCKNFCWGSAANTW
jgi:hypothetical protein